MLVRAFSPLRTSCTIGAPFFVTQECLLIAKSLCSTERRGFAVSHVIRRVPRGAFGSPHTEGIRRELLLGR